ncbi:tyrosine-protein phosphatase [Streptomyces sp. HNM0574]|uniref:tyrosine-protein phosphatase n=1 Tax=Streptomyces sp. HNM0574 TaxID=2714954 RepID=UPI001469CB96|nr:tyrosine-protein phosphatase [Streptomyces sp. HNM0574]NLU66852.1 tyrosine-protein phosphatase [Streptomyces sp. HNM0574]
MRRTLAWDGCFNVRDLGGIPTRDGGALRTGALVRSDAVDRLTRRGWEALWAHGVRTVIDLRNDDELRPDAAPRPSALTTLHLPLDGVEDREFWDHWGDGRHGTPLYYRPFLDRFPERTARVAEAVAHAEPGGVLFHCRIGRDRTGLIALLLLLLAGAGPEAVAEDFERSTGRLAAYFAAQGVPDQAPDVAAALRRAGTTAREQILALATDFDAAAHLRQGGLDEHTLRALRARLR